MENTATEIGNTMSLEGMKNALIEKHKDKLKNFFYHKPSDAAAEQVSMLRESFLVMGATILESLPQSREQSLAMTHLELARMYSILGTVTSDPTSEMIMNLEKPSGMSGA